MSPAGLFGSYPEPPRAARVFSRAARVSLVGLLLPGAVTAVFARAGYPLSGLARTLAEIIPALAFAASGVLAARAIGGDRRATVWLTSAFAITGVTVSLAYASLQGVTGREPVLLVTAVVIGGFVVGFAAAATGAAFGLGTAVPGTTRHQRAASARVGIARRGAAAGGIGGLIALCPFLLAAARLSIPIPYVTDALIVGSFLGSVIVPYWMIGVAVDAAIPTS